MATLQAATPQSALTEAEFIQRFNQYVDQSAIIKADAERIFSRCITLSGTEVRLFTLSYDQFSVIPAAEFNPIYGKYNNDVERLQEIIKMLGKSYFESIQKSPTPETANSILKWTLLEPKCDALVLELVERMGIFTTLKEYNAPLTFLPFYNTGLRRRWVQNLSPTDFAQRGALRSFRNNDLQWLTPAQISHLNNWKNSIEKLQPEQWKHLPLKTREDVSGNLQPHERASLNAIGIFFEDDPVIALPAPTPTPTPLPVLPINPPAPNVNVRNMRWSQLPYLNHRTIKSGTCGQKVFYWTIKVIWGLASAIFGLATIFLSPIPKYRNWVWAPASRLIS